MDATCPSICELFVCFAASMGACAVAEHQLHACVRYQGAAHSTPRSAQRPSSCACITLEKEPISFQKKTIRFSGKTVDFQEKLVTIDFQKKKPFRYRRFCHQQSAKKAPPCRPRARGVPAFYLSTSGGAAVGALGHWVQLNLMSFGNHTINTVHYTNSPINSIG
jgi:hypothetical protein